MCPAGIETKAERNGKKNMNAKRMMEIKMAEKKEKTELKMYQYPKSVFLEQYITPVLFKNIKEEFIKEYCAMLLNVILLKEITSIEYTNWGNYTKEKWIKVLDTYINAMQHERKEMNKKEILVFMVKKDHEYINNNLAKKYKQFPVHNDLHFGNNTELEFMLYIITQLKFLITQEKLSEVRHFAIAKKELLTFRNCYEIQALNEWYHKLNDKTFMSGYLRKKMMRKKTKTDLLELCKKTEEKYNERINIVKQYEGENAIQQYEVLSRIFISDKIKQLL